MFRFQHSEYLIGLTALPFLGAVFFLLVQWKKKTIARIGDPGLVQLLIRNFSPGRFLVKFSLALLAFSAVVLGAANPQKPGSMENIHRQGVDVMIVLDVSKSMLAQDSKPSRLERAKQLLNRLVDKLENDRLGIVLFAGRAYLQMPLTTDHGAARMYIQDASPDIVPTQGTVIAEALKMANASFNNKERKYKSIVLISDGEDHDPEALPVAKTLAADGVMINTVGIGSPEGATIIDPATNELKKDEQGQTVITKLNEAELQQLADASNGRYIRLDNIDDVLITLTQQLDSIEKKSLNDSEFIDYISYFQWLLGIALLLLLAEFFLSERRRERTIRRFPVAAQALFFTTVLVTCACLPSQAQSPEARIRSGNRYYNDKKIDQAQKEYEEAARQAPGNPAANYNLGNAQFRKNSFGDAEKSYDASISNAPDSATREKGLYNKGVAMIRQKKLQESIDAWKKALRLDASDEDARDNLQKALMELKQQQQQQQKDQKDKKEQKDKKDPNQQKKQDPQKQQQPPKPQPSRLNKQQVDQFLKALQEKENEAQEKMNQNKVKSSAQPEKDW